MASTFFAVRWCNTEVRCGWMVECESDGRFLEKLLCLKDCGVLRKLDCRRRKGNAFLAIDTYVGAESFMRLSQARS